METMVFAIDPGPAESAYVLWAGRILTMGKSPNDAILAELARLGHAVPPINSLAIEMVACYGMPVGAEVFETCVWIGRFMQAFGSERSVRIPRLEVKLHFCHDSRAKDPNVRKALLDRFGGPQSIRKGGPLYKVSGDIWAALALAITHAETR